MKDGLEWVVEEDARRILLSSPPRAGCRIGIIGSERRHEAGRSGCSFPLLSLPVRDASRRRRSPRRRSDGTRSGARDVAFPSSRSQLGMRAGDDGHRRRRSDGTRPGARDVAFPSPRSQLGMRAGDAEDETRGMDGTNHSGAF